MNMDPRKSPALRALYIILIPVVLLIILLNSGILQRMLPAATVHGKTCTVTAYNFYYYDCYNSFLAEHAQELSELGYDPDISAGKQAYNDTMTWQDYFLQLADHSLARTTYYCDLAEQAGYSFSEEELQPVQAKLDENAELQQSYGLSTKNFYISYYGSGMTEELYTEELTRKVKADAYCTWLLENTPVDESTLAEWETEHPDSDQKLVNLTVITLDVIPDRLTGEFGQEQLNALQEKLDALAERYQSGESFEQLQQAFSSCQLGNADGCLLSAGRETLPDLLSDWCIDRQDQLKSGDVFTGIDENSGTAYFVRFDGFRDGANEALIAINQERLTQELEAAETADYQVSHNKLGMTLVAG